MKRYNMSAKEIALMLMDEVREKVGVRATAGVKEITRILVTNEY